jgi:hypothetical protein
MAKAQGAVGDGMQTLITGSQNLVGAALVCLGHQSKAAQVATGSV